jgi:hypothetical protein
MTLIMSMCIINLILIIIVNNYQESNYRTLEAIKKSNLEKTDAIVKGVHATRSFS